MNNLLILERSSHELSFKSEGGAYVLEGIFGEIDVKNKNNRIYTEEEYLPQIEALQAKIKSSKLLGELDHPQTFDVSLKNVSHVIEEISYDTKSKQVKGRIRLLDTDAGKQAKALVDAGIPLQISSRAAGAVESNGKVKIKQLFTYDLVADPGFENAELKRVNESFGFGGNDILIYEMEMQNTEKNIQKNMDYVKVSDFDKYSKYIIDQINQVKEGIQAPVAGSLDNADSAKLTEYVQYLAEQLDKQIEYSNYLAERLDNSIQYTEHVAESSNNIIEYADYLAERLDNSIQYTEHIAEGSNNIVEYAEYLAEKLDNSIQYSEHVAEGALKLRDYAEYLAERLDNSIQYTEHVAEKSNQGIEYSEYLAEAIEKVKDYANYIVENLNDENEIIEIEEPTVYNGKGSILENFKTSIDSKLGEIITESKKARSNEPGFFKFISEDKKNEFNSLNENEQTAVKDALSNRGFLTEGQILMIWDNVLNPQTKNEPNVIKMMPAEYREKWAELSEAKKNQIIAQSKYHRLDTPYQVANFWQTRDLRDVKVVMERVESVNENVESKKELYDLTNVKEALQKRFKK